MNLKKKVVIIAGPNGAGKTTFATEFLPREAACPNFINVDLIAAGLNPFEPEKAAIRAGKIMIELINVSRTFPKGRGIKNITIRVAKGEWATIVGSAGAGKSTLLRQVYAAERPDSGEIRPYRSNLKKA